MYRSPKSRSPTNTGTQNWRIAGPQSSIIPPAPGFLSFLRKTTRSHTGPDGPLYWMIDTRSFPVRSGPFQQAGFPLSKNGKPAKVTPGISSYDPVESAEMRSVKSRLEQLDRENTAVQVIYPTMFLSYPITYDRDLAVAMMRAYNSWIADLTAKLQID